MLIQFNFSNYKSFRDDTALDMSATKITELSSHVITCGNEKILPIAAIFGPNASGKSNIHEAFRYMCTYVNRSFEYGGDIEKKGNQKFPAPTPFLMDVKSKNAASVFEVYYIDTADKYDRVYKYGFSVGKNGVEEEWLSSKAKTARTDFKEIFTRKGKTISMPEMTDTEKANLKKSLNNETLIVSLGSKLKIAKLKKVREWFLKNEFADFGRPIENFFLSEQIPHDFEDSKEIQEDVVKFFSAFDSSIIGFNVESSIEDDAETKKKVKIDAIHKMIGSNETVSIPLKKESAGTLKMFALYPLMKDVLGNGGILFIDELNARLHPLLVRLIIVNFVDKETNPNHAQLIFTSHDSWQLNNNSMRRDEVWFTEKTQEGLSTLYSLADFVDEDGDKIRKDENYEKNYLLGKYGAIPNLNKFDIEGGDDE